MMERQRVCLGSRTVLVLLVLLTIALAINIALTHRTTVALSALGECPARRSSLPCEAIPVRFVLDDPACVDKLLRAMNVTNVRILPRGSRAQGLGLNMTPSVQGRTGVEAG